MDPKKIQELWKLTDFEMELILNPYGCEPEPVVFYCYYQLREYSQQRLRDQDISEQTSPEYETFYEYLVWFTELQPKFAHVMFDDDLPTLVDFWFSDCNYDIRKMVSTIDMNKVCEKIEEMITQIEQRERDLSLRDAEIDREDE